MNYLLIILYSMGIMSIYSIGNEMNKLIPIVAIFSVYIISLIRVIRKNNDYKVNFVNIAIYLFVLLSIIQSIRVFQQNGLGSLKYMSLVLIFFICVFCNEKHIYKFFCFLKILGIFCILYGIVEFITNDNIFFSYMNLESAFYKEQFKFYGIVRISTIFGHPIVYGTFLICLFWIIYFLKGSRQLKLYEKIIMVLIIVNLGLTQSRSSWLTFLITIIIYCLPKLNFKLDKINRNTLFRYIIIVIGIIILHEVVIYVLGLIFNRFNDVFTFDGKASLIQRIGAINLIIGNLIDSSFLELIFGKGLFSTVNLLKNNTIFIQGFISIDNQYLTLLYEGGLSILILYCIIFISSIFEFCRNSQFKENQNINNICYFILFTVSINMLFYEAISTKWYSISMLLFISLAVLSKNLKYISRRDV